MPGLAEEAPVAYKDVDPVIEVGKHGLLIRGEDGRQSLLLPQVPVDRGCDRDEFLAVLRPDPNGGIADHD